MSTRSAVGVTWRVIGSILTLLMVLWGTVNAVDSLARTDDPVDLSIPTAGMTRLEIDANYGVLEIRGTGGDRIRVVGTSRNGIASTSVTADASRGAAKVSVRCGTQPFALSCGADLQIEVPRDLAIIVDAVNTSVRASDLDAAVSVQTTNERITGVALSGPLVLRTTNAELTATALGATDVELQSSNSAVRAEFVTPPERVRVTTSNESASVVVPEGPAAYAVDLDTTIGSEQIGVRTDPDSDRRISVRSSNDDVSVAYP